MRNNATCHIIYDDGSAKRPLSQREWLVTNGLGGYASGTVGWENRWRYHGILVSAEHTPLGRMMMLRQIVERATVGDAFSIDVHEEDECKGPVFQLEEFRLEYGLPVWRYRMGNLVFERVLFMPHRQNSSYVLYRVLESDGPVTFTLRPSIQIRPHDASNDQTAEPLAYKASFSGKRCEISAGTSDLPVLRFAVQGASFSFTSDGGGQQDMFFHHDAERGYNAVANAWTPGYFSLTLTAGQEAALLASTENWTVIEALEVGEAREIEHMRRKQLLDQALPQAREGMGERLVLAADQFLIEPISRIRERVRAQAKGDSVRAVIAGYHWFTDWGRDTFISLEGLTLATGRPREARWILRNYGHYVRDGLVPNLFPEGADNGLYHTADASLWFFHAMDRYVTLTGDRETLCLLLPELHSIAEHHLRGTRFGIGVDPADGLLRQGEEGYQLTWMDAKVDGWVVTPRRGKSVELNGLWYNAIMLLAQWLEEEGQAEKAHQWRDHAERARLSFNANFWYEPGGYLYDVIGGPNGHDNACRPNQLLSFSLRHPVLDQTRWEDVLRIVQEKLLTPMGLRTLSREHPDYKAQYFGDLRARDAAYHQGTVWPWLIGPFIDSWLAVYPGDKAGARVFLQEFAVHLDDACTGSVSEICDAESPFIPRGCISQAWSVAEILRCWVKTAP